MCIHKHIKGDPAMLKSQDCAILLKLLAHYGKHYTQRQLAEELQISLAEINAGIKRLLEAGLLRLEKNKHPLPVRKAAIEFLTHGLKYIFPGSLGSYTRGTATAIGAPVFKNKVVLGDDPLPVWPDAHGSSKGLALEPIHASLPSALHDHPDPEFYELLALTDAIRQGRAREKKIAIQLIQEKLK